jgi:soluble lytic murein transglycosylase-like protein
MDEMAFIVRIKPYFPFIISESYLCAIEPELICAFIWQESGGETRAIRFEDKIHFNYTANKYAKQLNISQITEVNCQNTSFGLLQILGVKARELGFEGYLTDLLIPEIGLKYGCKNLGILNKKYKNMEDVIVSYNSGSPLRRDGKYINEEYLESVKLRWSKIEKMDLFK